MARIPVYQESQAPNRLMAVSELSAPDAGAGLIGRSMQQVGTALNKAAAVTANIFEENSKSWAAQTSSEEALFWTERTAELKSASGADGSNYVKTLNLEYQARTDKLIAQAPNDVSRKFLSQNLLSLRQNLLFDGMKFEVIESRANSLNSFDKSSANIAAAVTKNPDLNFANQQLGQQAAIIDGSRLLPSQKQEAKDKMGATVAVALVASLAKTNPAALRVMLSENMPKVSGKLDQNKLFAAQQFVESTNNPNAVSDMGAVGLMQVLRSTAMKPGFSLPNIFDFAEAKGIPVGPRNEITATTLLKDPKVGAEYGQAYMTAMLKRYNNDPVKSLAAYNMGPNAADKWIADGADMDKLPEETRKYIPAVLSRSGITSGKGEGSTVLDALPISERIKYIQLARDNESAQIVESTAGAVFKMFGPQSDNDPIKIDVLNAQIDRTMAGNTVEERKTAKALISQYASAHKASADQRIAARQSVIWSQVINNKSMTEIQASPEWNNLDGKDKATLIGQISTFRTKPTSPEQTALYYELTADKQKLASMSTEQVLVAAGSLGNTLGSQLVKDRAGLITPQDIGQAQIDDDTFKRLAAEAGLKPYDRTPSTSDKKALGELKYVFERDIQAQQNALKRPLTRVEKEEVMYRVINDKVYVDGFFSDTEKPLFQVTKDELGESYVLVNKKKVYVNQINASERLKIIDALRGANRPVTEAAIAQIWSARQDEIKANKTGGGAK
jgi:soluble lytic murein transglycosylase-like protein